MSLTKMLLKAAVPVPRIENFQRFLFVGPHPDDIEIGAGATAAKLADYFGVTTDYLLEQTDERAPAAPVRTVSDEDIKFALFGGDGEITDAMFDEVKRFAAFIRQREENKE